MLTCDEQRVILSLVEAWNRFLLLDELHPDDTVEFRTAIHSAQNIVLARQAMKEYNQIKPTCHNKSMEY